MVVLDTSALLAYLKDEPGSARVEEEWTSRQVAMCSVNLGEALYLRVREVGVKSATWAIDGLRARMQVVDPDWELVHAAAAVKSAGGLSYADAFCIATAQRLDAPLLTTDPEIITRAGDLAIVDLRQS